MGGGDGVAFMEWRCFIGEEIREDVMPGSGILNAWSNALIREPAAAEDDILSSNNQTQNCTTVKFRLVISFSFNNENPITQCLSFVK